jgi:uncharacterized protein YllA (UPF0747 family)
MVLTIFEQVRFLGDLLTEDELMDRFSYENFMLFKTEEIIDKYLHRKVEREKLNRVNEMRKKIKELEKQIEKEVKGTVKEEDGVNDLVEFLSKKYKNE